MITQILFPYNEVLRLFDEDRQKVFKGPDPKPAPKKGGKKK